LTSTIAMSTVTIVNKPTFATSPPQTITVPFYKQIVVLKGIDATTQWYTINAAPKGTATNNVHGLDTAATYTFILPKADTSCIIYSSTYINACHTASIQYTVIITNDLPFLNTADTTISMNIGDSIDVAFQQGFKIQSETVKGVVDTVKSVIFSSTPQNLIEQIPVSITYDIITFKALKSGIDTLIWKLTTIAVINSIDSVMTTITKRIIFHVGTQTPNDTCPIIVKNPTERCSATNQIVGNPYTFVYTYTPQNVYPIDTLIEKIFPVRITVTFNNGCKVTASESPTETIVQSPIAPQTDNSIQCEIGSVPSLIATSSIVTTGQTTVFCWQDLQINTIEPVFVGPIFNTGKNIVGVFNYQVYAHDIPTGCNSLPVMVKLQIFDPTLPSINGSVLAASTPFSDGIVQLFKQKGTSYTAVSTQNINADGSFNFKWLDATNYLIRALPNDLQSVYLPSYYVNSSDWQTAHVINLKGKIIGLHLNLVESPLLSTGTGSISGSVTVADTNFASPLKTFEPIKMSILVMQNGQVVAYALTDANGKYKVDNLPDGTYDIYVEAPDYAKFAKTVTISGGSSASVDFTLKNGVVETAASIETDKNVILYPNPASERITLQTDKEILSTEVINAEGLIVTTGIGNEKQINVSQLPAGVYTVKMIMKTEILTKRFIKQ
jgi:hypothetical protein